MGTRGSVLLVLHSTKVGLGFLVLFVLRFRFGQIRGNGRQAETPAVQFVIGFRWARNDWFLFKVRALSSHGQHLDGRHAAIQLVYEEIVK